MLRSNSNFKPESKVVNCILMNGGVGDHMGSLVAVQHIVKNYPWIILHVWVPDFLVEFARHVIPKGAVIRGFVDMTTKYNRKHHTISTEWDRKTSPMKMHSVDYAFAKLCDEAPSIEHKNYLQIRPEEIDISHLSLPEKYVVLCTGFTAPVREFDPSSVNQIVKYIVDKNYVPVFLGQKETKTGTSHTIVGQFSDKIDFSKGLDLVDKTTLLQAAKIMGQAKAVVGVDCGLMHVAGCTQTAIVGGFTTVRPELRAPIRNDQLGWNFYSVSPDVSLECRNCQSDTNFLFGHDYRYCIYKDYLCVKQMTAAKFTAHLDKILQCAD